MSTVQNKEILYGHLPPKNIVELKPWDTVHVNLVGPYSKSIIQQQPGFTVILKNTILIYITMINPATGWFNIVKIPKFDLEEVTIRNDEYIYKSSTRVSQLFTNTWLCRYLCQRKLVFDNGSEFKRDFTPFLKDF